MTALSSRGPVNFQSFGSLDMALTTSATVQEGSLVALVIGTGKVQAATGASNELVIGKAMRKAVQSSTAPNAEIKFTREHFGYWCVNDTGTAVVAADVGKICYVLDDQTVTMAVTGKGIAGRVWAVSSSAGVLVEPLPQLTANRSSGITLAYVTNDCVMTAAQCQDGNVFDVPTTAAASTITLPVTGVPDGTTLTFVADATKNGHTVTYRFGTTAITAALTASKIHRVQVTKLGSGWGATSTVSP
jgi:hypothetical protein